MKMKRSTILMLVMSLILILPIPTQAYGEQVDMEYVDKLIKTAQEYYIEDLPRDVHLENAIKGVFENLDQHSKYYNPEEFEEMMKDVDGSFVGIGVYISEQDGYITILDAIDGSPAKKAGLKAGDIIWTISGKSAYGITSQEAVSMIKGEEGTRVRLSIKRGTKGFTVILKRAKVEIKPVEYEIIDNIGYIKLDQFSHDSHAYIMEALNHMDENSINNIILDLRNNPGGYLDQAIRIGNQFIKKGPITHVKYRDQSVITYNSYLDEVKYDLVVLVNENSASASELFAAAVKDTESGIVIGAKTFGKGTVQEIILFQRGDGVKITRAEYFSPHMNKIDGLGVTPNIVVKNEAQVDNQMIKAIEIFTHP